MKILLVTNMYPSVNAPTYGIFVKEQEIAVCKEYPDVEYTIAFIDGSKSKKEYINSIFRIHRLIKENSFDVIHIHYGFSGLFLLFKKLAKKIPILVTLHGGDIQSEQGKNVQFFFTKLILKKTSAAITLNSRMDSIVRQYIKNTQIIPCSVNTDLFKPQEQPIVNTRPKQVKIIFPSDRTRYVKNYPLFEKTIYLLKSKYNIDCTTFEVKNISRQQVVSLYQNADLMIMTSISEGSPQVVKEAMACNLPVISTNVGDVSVLLDGVKDSGVSLDMNAESLAKLAFLAIHHKIDGISGREKIFQMQLDDKSIARKIYNMYLSLIQSNHYDAI